jgi:peptidoglycan-associated lipoprotein
MFFETVTRGTTFMAVSTWTARAMRLLVVLLVGVTAAACANNENQPNSQLTGRDGAVTPGTNRDFSVNVGDIVYFTTDSTDLSPEATATLQKQSQWLQQYPQYTITIEGHADERGTREYNIALGARRATTVRNFLAQNGVNGSRIRTISYGKERPVAVCNDISCWSQNRRAQTVLNARTGAVARELKCLPPPIGPSSPAGTVWPYWRAIFNNFSGLPLRGRVMLRPEGAARGYASLANGFGSVRGPPPARLQQLQRARRRTQRRAAWARPRPQDGPGPEGRRRALPRRRGSSVPGGGVGPADIQRHRALSAAATLARGLGRSTAVAPLAATPTPAKAVPPARAEARRSEEPVWGRAAA